MPTSLRKLSKDPQELDKERPDLLLKLEMDKINDLKNILFLKGKSITDTK